MGYYFNEGYGTRAKKGESPEDKQYRLSSMYNDIFFKIEKMEDAKTVLQVRNMINAFAKESGVSDWKVTELNQKLKQKLSDMIYETRENISSINNRIDEIKQFHFQESELTLKQLNEQSEHELVKFVLQLDTTKGMKEANRRRIGNYIANANRAQAIALARMCISDTYSDLFSSHQKDVLLQKCKNPLEITFEKDKEEKLQAKGKELGHESMKLFQLNKVQKQIANSEKPHFFSNGEG